MPDPVLHHSRRGTALLALLLAGCGGKPAAPEPAVAPAPVLAPIAQESIVVRVDTVVLRDPAADQRIARLELQVIEKEAELDQLQTRLDDARREVVRAMSRVQSLATRAEAASAMAEAEVAVNALAGSAAGRGAPEVVQARSLLAMGTEAFNRSNYGGAVYLAGQAKTLASSGRSRVGETGRGAPRSGETPFAAPLRLQATGRTNVREGPGTDQPVLFTVDRGTPVTAYSAVGDWVKVTDDAGRTGWIIRSRLGRREGAN